MEGDSWYFANDLLTRGYTDFCQMCSGQKIPAETPLLSLFAFNLLIDNGTNDISYHIVLLDEDERPWQVL